MQELNDFLLNIEKDNSYAILESIKESSTGKTERVQAPDGKVYIRKYVNMDETDIGGRYGLFSDLRHPGLPVTHEYYELVDSHVLIQEYIQGEMLSEIIGYYDGLSLGDIIDYSSQLISVLSYLHSNRSEPIIHRDIKPDNIMIDSIGRLKLIDFGAARRFDSTKKTDTVYVGTPGYAPPEQFGFGQTDIRADIYAVGMTIYTMATGKTPNRDGSNTLENLDTIHQDIQNLIVKATAFNPNDRYANIDELYEDLNRVEIDKTDHVKKPIPKMAKTSKTEHNSKMKPTSKMEQIQGKEPSATDYSKTNNHSESDTPHKVKRHSNNFFPKHRDWPLWVKVLLIPLDSLYIIGIPLFIVTDFGEKSGFGFMDDLLRFAEDMFIIVFIMLPVYVFSFNLFDVGNRVKFFRKRPLFKKVLICVLLFIVAGVCVIFTNSFHSDAYLHAKSLAAS